jgi:Na+/proline symporter
MAGELNALASTTCVDIYKRNITKEAAPTHYVKASRLFTILWAVLAMIFAMLASFAENLIQFVNIVGSLFYGTILGIFLTAFYVKRVGGPLCSGRHCWQKPLSFIVMDSLTLHSFFTI